MMKMLIHACILVLSCSVILYALDDTEESMRKVDPALGIERVLTTKPPAPPLFDAHFTGSQEKEFILYQWEPEECVINFNKTCLGRTSPRWKRVLGISGSGGKVTGNGNIECGARVILTGWYRANPASEWVQARATRADSVAGEKPNSSPIGVVATFEDGSGGQGRVKFIHGCPP